MVPSCFLPGFPSPERGKGRGGGGGREPDHFSSHPQDTSHHCKVLTFGPGLVSSLSIRATAIYLHVANQRSKCVLTDPKPRENRRSPRLEVSFPLHLSSRPQNRHNPPLTQKLSFEHWGSDAGLLSLSVQSDVACPGGQPDPKVDFIGLICLVFVSMKSLEMLSLYKR